LDEPQRKAQTSFTDDPYTNKDSFSISSVCVFVSASPRFPASNNAGSPKTFLPFKAQVWKNPTKLQNPFLFFLFDERIESRHHTGSFIGRKRASLIQAATRIIFIDSKTFK
jgi:hypothetical protein